VTGRIQQSFAFQDSANTKSLTYFQGGNVRADGGVMLVREIDERSCMIDQLAACFTDHHCQALIDHTVPELLRQRILGMASFARPQSFIVLLSAWKCFYTSGMNEENQEQDHHQGEASAPAPRATDSNPYASSVTPAPSRGLQPSKEERNWALAAHISALSTFIGIPGFIGPLVVWLVKKDELPFASAQAKEALNFQISLFAYSIACLVLIFTVIGAVIGFPGLFVLAIISVVFSIIAAIKAGEGTPYRYPMTFRLIE